MTEDKIIELTSTDRHSVAPCDLDSAFDESGLRPLRICREENRDEIPADDNDYKFDQAYATFCRSFRLSQTMKGDTTRSTLMGCVLDISIPEKETDHKLDAKSIFSEMLLRLQEIVSDMH